MINARSSKIQRMKRLTFLLTMIVLIAAACGTPEPFATPSVTASPSAITTETITLPATPKQPTHTATPILIDGALTIKVNIRNGPGTSYDSLGQMEAGEKVQIIARDSQGAWYQILYPASPQGRGWVAAQYVTVAPETEVPLEATPTPAGPTGRVIQRLNVRSGPGTTFETLGLLEPGAVVSLIGKNATASWFQIDYPAGLNGHGWVTAQYVQTDATADLPVLDDYGNTVTPSMAGSPSGPVLIPTPTIGPAYADGDSNVNPAIRVPFSVSGTHQFDYSSQVSTPEGDSEDWIEFTPYTASGINARLTFSLACTGNGTLSVELWQGSTILSGWGTLACSEAGKSIQLHAGQAYLIRLAPVAGDGLRLVAYTLIVQNNP
jgi:uncharacterized protein YgiM (DUF1202 family)